MNLHPRVGTLCKNGKTVYYVINRKTGKVFEYPEYNWTGAVSHAMALEANGL